MILALFKVSRRKFFEKSVVRSERRLYSLRAFPTVSVELKFSVELNSFSDQFKEKC